MCGKEGRGGGLLGSAGFPTKSRTTKQGGPWTFEKSVEYRPIDKHGKSGQAIMNKAKECINKCINIYISLEKKILIKGELPSGWDEEDLHRCILSNLR